MTINGSQTASTAASGLSTSPLQQLGWSKKLTEVSKNYWSDLLSLVAKRLEADAEFIRGLAASGDASDLFKRQSEFIRGAWVDYLKVLPKALEVPKTLGITEQNAN